ncbi:Putative AC transposase [Apostasia shenzhenica]|uniref:AC transposase n=1 Tax=Apostasia shenzhenica TaxID=1088818 RepID=A0A2I0BBQ2_9ASPA|nr:Putative AC transposase [Apostasia shenzhenica]
MCVTAHYIDANWILQSRIISFSDLDPPHTGAIISETIFEILLEWGIQNKVSTITLDNTSSNDKAAENLRYLFSRRSDFQFMEKFFHVRCAAHILNLMVQDGLKVITSVISKIRNFVLYLKRSPSRLFKFGEIARQLGIYTFRGLRIDVPIRWNSTFKMLDVAFHYKSVFPEYACRDLHYVWLPLDQEWDMYERIRDILSVFDEVTEIFSGTKFSTANKFLSNLVKVKRALDKGILLEISCVRDMTIAMKLKFDKYWSDCHTLLTIVSILDPCVKMFALTNFYREIYGPVEVNERIEDVKSSLSELYSFYAVDKNVTTHEGSIAPSTTSSLLQSKEPRGDPLNDLYLHIKASTSMEAPKSDLEVYLSEQCIECEDSKFNILEWWKLSSMKY